MQVTITEHENKSEVKIIALQMPETLRQKIREEAFKQELSFSAMIRKILFQYFIDKEDKDANNN